MTWRQKNKLITHLLVWIGCISLYLAVFFPLARVMGLDLEALLVNLAQDYGPSEPILWFAKSRWIRVGKILLMCGSAPLFLLSLSSLAYRLIPGRWELESPLSRLPRGAQLALAAVSLILYLVFCFPLSLGLGVWLQVEAYWWVQWYQNLDPLMAQIRQGAPLVLLPGVVAGGMWCAWCVAQPWPRGDVPPSLGRRALRAAWLVVALPALLVALGPLAVGAVHAARVLAAPGPGAFEARCGGCHDLALSLYYIKTPVEWERTVKTQKEEEKVPLTPDEEQAVLGFLKGSRSFSDGWTFHSRCQRCHISTWGWADRSPAEWARVVDGLARWSPYYFRPDIKDQILRHLGRTRSGSSTLPGLSAKTHASFEATAKVCARCHSLSHGADRYQGKGAAEIRRVVQRMNRKLARPLPATQLPGLTRSYGELISDPQRFDRLFPHDRPQKDGWVKW